MSRPVTAGPGGMLGEYVPFYFCPRSVMLYVISRGSSDYSGKEREIVHLVSRVSIAARASRWVFTDRHAEYAHAEYFADQAHLDKIDWTAVEARQWSGCKEEKQAEFLVKDFFPWGNIQLVGARDTAIVEQARALIATSSGTLPPVELQPGWYYK